MTEPRATTTSCPTCGAEALPEDQFCENCGAELRPAVPAVREAVVPVVVPASSTRAAAADREGLRTVCGQCGGTDFADGYCTTCGAPAVKERDHWTEQAAAWLAAVCDRGIRHHRNEDAVAISAGTDAGAPGVLVVCDGVSSAADSDVASLAAARAARDVLSAARPDGGSAAGRVSAWNRALAEATAAANDRTVEAAANPTGRTPNAGRSDSPPSCTFVAAVVDGPLVVTGWVGDSRAYWLPDAGPGEQLSVDDSWATEQVRLGVPREQAERLPKAHAITRWLGVDSPDTVPQCGSFTVSEAGWLLLCSDGLWNYCSPPEAMADLVHQRVAAGSAEPAALAAALVDWANEQGGHDNITVAVARLGAGAQPPGEET